MIRVLPSEDACPEKSDRCHFFSRYTPPPASTPHHSQDSGLNSPSHTAELVHGKEYAPSGHPQSIQTKPRISPFTFHPPLARTHTNRPSGGYSDCQSGKKINLRVYGGE